MEGRVTTYAIRFFHVGNDSGLRCGESLGSWPAAPCVPPLGAVAIVGGESWVVVTSVWTYDHGSGQIRVDLHVRPVSP